MLNLIQTAYAQGYTPLAPLPGMSGSVDTSSLTTYLQTVFQIGIGVAAGLAVIMIVIGGIEYMSTDAIGGKEEGKDRITSALWGLMLALTAWLILNTINPTLLNTNLTIGQANTTGASASNAVTGTSNTSALQAAIQANQNYNAAASQALTTGTVNIGGPNGINIGDAGAGTVQALYNGGGVITPQDTNNNTNVSLPAGGFGSGGTITVTPNAPTITGGILDQNTTNNSSAVGDYVNNLGNIANQATANLTPQGTGVSSLPNTTVTQTGLNDTTTSVNLGGIQIGNTSQ